MKRNKSFKKNTSLYLLAGLLLVFFLFSLFNPPSLEEIISLSQLVKEINEGKVKEILVSGETITVYYQDGKKAIAYKESTATIDELLINLGVEKEKIQALNLRVEKEKGASLWIVPLLITILPILVLIGFFWLLFKQAKIGATQTFDFTKAKARLFGAGAPPKEKITFDDVAGLKEAKEELQEIIDFLKNPQKYLRMGARIPRGVLLVGPPGCGKTLLARAVAGESNVPFFSISGSEFTELFIGVGPARVRDLFHTAKKAGTSIIFIDELDAIGRTRGPGIGGGHEEREQTLNQILVEMDGFEKDSTVIVIAASNRPDILDSALLRPGRFDRRIVLDLPDINEREEILKIHCRGKPLAKDVNLREVAERTPGFSGADLANLVNEAAILAAKKNQSFIFQKDLLESIEKVLLGPERKSYVLSQKEKEITAFHEAGHALVSAFTPGAEPVRKISIVARGVAAGYTLKMPTEDRRIKTKSEFLAEMATLLGGFCAEKLIFKEISTGAANDLKKVSRLARKLVKEYGMSSLGPISFGETEELMFLGKEFGEEKNYSEKTAALIDKQVAKFIKEAEKKATRILKQKKKLLIKIAQTLMEKETIEKEEFDTLIGKTKKKTKPLTTKLKLQKIKIKNG